MKIVGQPLRRLINEEGYTEITFLVKNYRNQQEVKTLEKDKDYRIELEVVKSKRTLEQNRKFWAIVHDISKAINGSRANDDDDWNIYINILERTGAKFEYIAVLPEAEKILKDQFRAVKLMNSFEHKGRTFNSYKVFYGQSKFNTKEMTLLIETALDMAAKCGIDIAYYEGGY